MGRGILKHFLKSDRERWLLNSEFRDVTNADVSICEMLSWCLPEMFLSQNLEFQGNFFFSKNFVFSKC